MIEILLIYIILLLYLIKFNKKKITKKKKIGLLTNEIPPIIYGGVSTWIINFINMFKNNPNYEIIPIFLAYQDSYRIDLIKNKYKKLRIIYKEKDIKSVFSDIDICVNNIWISLDTIKKISELYSNLKIISVCHSLIKMEHITNLGSQYTRSYEQQEIVFQNSDYIVLISNAEKEYYESFGYDKYKAIPVVIYNSYIPKYGKREINITNKKTIGYIGRHVPRKRPELPLLAAKKLELNDFKNINMGVDFTRDGNKYWEKLNKNNNNLEIIEFTSDKKVKEKFWNSIAVNCITGIYEPFGYTMCETLDRGIPAIVQNIDGPKEIIGDCDKYVYMYDVDKKNMDNDIKNFSIALQKFLNTDLETRKENALKAKERLKHFHPNVISIEWCKLFDIC